MISRPVSVSSLGRCLQLYLLMQLQLTSMTEPLSGQSKNFFSCDTDEHLSGSHCCKNCSAGEFVQESCTTPHTLGQCEKCHPGTFTEASNGLQFCIPCSSCGRDQEPVANCSATSDQKCRCRMGLFYSDADSTEFCRRCTKCPQGVPVLQRCNSTANTVCGQADTNHRNRLYLLISLSTLFVIAIVCCYLRKVRPCRSLCCTKFSGEVSPWEQVTA
ncbi:tumor necrosis factor receptor superfamily member 22 isoform X1 [Mesocricetus auratus]|uniref:Tumor necrosis factor receptor superfamily member 22 isoform X1 n=1 Tax=Mesocricetus auratus TaxID=10036 RepID=A0A1U8CP86_MESAU|nr:tumor necrosis factor receptor superfamily member 22 isoform X1 [Mesocricetus auratus]